MLNEGSPYEISDAFSEMDVDDVNLDVERFYTKYVVSNGMDSIPDDDVDLVFFLYIAQYFTHKDKLFNEKLN